MGTKKTFKPRRRVVATAASRVPHVPDLDRVVSEAEAAQILGYSKHTLRRKFRAGRAPARALIGPSHRLSVVGNLPFP